MWLDNHTDSFYKALEPVSGAPHKAVCFVRGSDPRHMFSIPLVSHRRQEPDANEHGRNRKRMVCFLLSWRPALSGGSDSWFLSRVNGVPHPLATKPLGSKLPTFG